MINVGRLSQMLFDYVAGSDPRRRYPDKIFGEDLRQGQDSRTEV